MGLLDSMLGPIQRGGTVTMLHILKDRTIEQRLKEVWEAHRYVHEDRRCICGKPIADYNAADVHFDVEIYKAGMKAAARQLRVEVTGER